MFACFFFLISLICFFFIKLLLSPPFYFTFFFLIINNDFLRYMRIDLKKKILLIYMHIVLQDFYTLMNIAIEFKEREERDEVNVIHQ